MSQNNAAVTVQHVPEKCYTVLSYLTKKKIYNYFPYSSFWHRLEGQGLLNFLFYFIFNTVLLLRGIYICAWFWTIWLLYIGAYLLKQITLCSFWGLAQLYYSIRQQMDRERGGKGRKRLYLSAWKALTVYYCQTMTSKWKNKEQFSERSWNTVKWWLLHHSERCFSSEKGCLFLFNKQQIHSLVTDEKVPTAEPWNNENLRNKFSFLHKRKDQALGVTIQNSCTYAIKNKPSTNKTDYIKYLFDHYINSCVHSVMKKSPNTFRSSFI